MSAGTPFCRRVALALSVWSAALVAASGAFAQSAPNTVGEVIVSARKRQESILKVPVVEQAIPQEKLQQLQVTTMSDLPNLVPGLILEHTFLSIGTLVSIRGVGTTSTDPGVQQSVSLNIDGLSLTSGLAFNSGLFDVGQVEVLKGPQSLFYGLGSPGGVISLRTADPTSKPEVIGEVGYEFYSVQPRVELIASGPVTDTLKLRLATSWFQQDGYFTNPGVIDPGTGAKTPNSRAPNQQDEMVRLTALWDPNPKFSARLKLNYNYDKENNSDTLECADSPGGTAPIPGLANEIGAAGNCGISNQIHTVDMDPAAFPDAINGGTPFTKITQTYGTLELNYRPINALTLTSVTGYYGLIESSQVNAPNSTFAGPYIGAINHFRDHNFSEELRANSDFSGPLNFTLGALYQEDNLRDRVTITGNTALGLPGLLADGLNPVESRTYSVFGQARWAITKQLELAAGARWTDEKRVQSPFNNLTDAPVAVPVNAVVSNNVSPEVTLTYQPTDDMTFFGSYKLGYKSGGFTISTPVVANVNNSFQDEKVYGGEVGMKSRWFDRQVSVEIAPYYYTYTNLQVGVISPPSGGLPVIQTVNAASAKVYGVDFDTTYRPASIQGLALNLSALWNHARYTKFTNAPCWGGQTITLGCNQLFNAAAGVYTAQDLSGTPLARAPDWQLSGGFEYTIPVGHDYKLTFTNSNSFSSDYVRALAINRPNMDNYQKAYGKVDLGLTLHSPRDRWELSVLVKNVGDTLVSSFCQIGLVKGGAIVANASGGNSVGPLGVDQETCFVDPGREVWLRLTVRPFN